MKAKSIFAGIACLFVLPASAQTAQENIAAGNEKYRQEDYKGAQSHYENAGGTVEGTYNLGNALYNQQKFEEAAEKYAQAAQMATDSQTKSKAYHNLGNAMLQQKKYQESIDAYKKALRDNPNNADTKYNLSYAQQMLKKQQEQQQQQQDNKNKEKQKQDQQKKQQQDPQQPDNKKQNEPDPKDMSKDELDRVLKSLNEDDKAVQDKVNKQKSKPAGGDPEKDW